MQQTDVVENGLDKLLPQFRDKQNTLDLVSTYLEQVQDTEDLVFTVLGSRDLDVALGRALDQIGAYVGESRQGRSDSVYRDAIRLRIIINNSAGTPNDIIQAGKLIISNNIIYSEVYPAKVRVEVPDVAPSLTASSRLKRAVMAGVDLEVTYPTETAGITYGACASNINVTLEANPDGFYA